MKTCAPGDCWGAERLCGNEPCAIIRSGESFRGPVSLYARRNYSGRHVEMAQVIKKQEHELTKPGKGMDLSFLGKPHEHDPRRAYSTTGTDWQARVDFDRLRRDRLARARMMMAKHDIGALVCFVGENVRYITSVFQGNWKNNIFIRYCVLPRDGEPVLFETAGSDLECAKIDAPWLEGNIRPAITWKWSETAETMMADRMAQSIVAVLKENGVDKERIGIDVYDPAAYAAFQKL